MEEVHRARCGVLVLVLFFWLCCVACGILVSWPGIERTLPVLEGRFLTTGPPGKSRGGVFTSSPGTPSPQITVCSPTQKLSGNTLQPQPCPCWVFMEASLHRHDWLNHWPLVIDSISNWSHFPGGLRSGAESSNPPITQSVPLATSPHP